MINNVEHRLYVAATSQNDGKTSCSIGLLKGLGAFAKTTGLINGHPTLQTVQQFPREHVAEMAKELHDTWRAWLQQRPAPSSLRNYAKSCGECSYLALPIKMSWQEAARFCQWQQGSLVSPSSEDEFSRLRAYLASVTYRNAISNYHLGISGDGKSNISWHSGRPCCWCLFSPEDECSLLQQGGVIKPLATHILLNTS